jgi:hypothetical protein
MGNGRLEGRISVPLAGFDFTVDDSGGAGAVAGQVLVGDYFLSSPATTGSSFIAALEAALNVAAPTDTFAVSLSAGVSGTGKVTITSTGTAAITWTTDALRTLLGFDGDLPAGTTWTGESQARALWLPDCPYQAPNVIGAWRGHRESDFSSIIHASGHGFAHMGRELQATELAWHAVSRARTWQGNETTANASWERFHRDCVWGLSGFGKPGGPIRFHPDAASDVAFVTYLVPGQKAIKPVPATEGYAAGRWKVELARLVVDPTYAAYGA